MKKVLYVLSLAGVIGMVGISAVWAGHDKPCNVEKKAAEWSADCVYAAMSSGAYVSWLAADLGAYCRDAIAVVTANGDDTE